VLKLTMQLIMSINVHKDFVGLVINDMITI